MKRSFREVWDEHEATGTCISCGAPGFPACDACNDPPEGRRYPRDFTPNRFHHRNAAGEHVDFGRVERHPGAE